MKIILFFAIIMCCASLAIAQDSLSYKHTFQLQINSAFPTGDFDKAEFEEDYPDLARNGTLVSGSYQRRMTSHISVGSSVHFRTLRFDIDEFARESDELVLDRDSEPWRSWFTMADVYLYSTEGRAGNFFIKGSAGASFNRSAQVNVSTVYGPIELPADNAAAFAWGYGGGIRGFQRAWSIILEFSFLNTSPTFSGRNPNGKAMEYKQPMHTFNYGVAISYSF